MPKNNSEIVYLRGKLYWAKVLGDPVDNYDRNGKEWTLDLSLDADGVRQLKSIKVNGQPVKNIKNKDDERGNFASFKQVFRQVGEDRDGKPRFTSAPDVMDADGKPWDENEKLGNGTTADLKFRVVDNGKGRYPGVYPMAIRVLDHVPYQDQTFAPLGEDDEYYNRKPTGRHLPTADDDLDDDLV